MTIETIKASIRQRHHLADAADVRIIASSLIIKAFDDDSDPYKFTARITTDSLDRQDEVVIPQGGDLKEFIKSGIVAWNHIYTEPVGFPNKTAPIIRSENAIEMGGVFMKRPADYQGEFKPDFARAFVTQAAAAGINVGVSIGFLPLESRKPTKADIAKWGEGLQVVHSKWKLLEFSIAPVQANQDAYVTAVGKGLMQRATLKAVGIELPDPIAKPIVKSPEIVSHPVIEMVMIVAKRKPVDVGSEINRQVRNEILRSFGRVYV